MDTLKFEYMETYEKMENFVVGVWQTDKWISTAPDKKHTQ